jgi:hypothetical protein
MPSNPRRAAADLAAALAFGYVLFYFSETLFWARWKDEDTVGGLVGTWLVYSALAYVVLAAFARFGSRAWPTVFLVGALFGWLVEGVVVQTTYSFLPLSISFTALAWHALVSVMVGWLLLAGRDAPISARASARLGILAGLAYGVWAIHWWVEDGVATGVAEFAAYSTAAAALLVVALTVLARRRTGFVAGRWGPRVAAALLVVVYAVVAIPAAGILALILPPLLALTLVALRRGAPRAPEPVRFAPNRLRDLAWLLTLPAVAVAVYAVATALGLNLETNILVFVVLTPTGFAAYAVAAARLWRRPTVEFA